MALIVGRISNSMLRGAGSRFTSFITGNLPYAPVPTTSRWHLHGISSSTDRGGMSKLVAEFFRWLFLAFADLPMVDHDIVFVGAAVDLEGIEVKFVEAHTVLLRRCVLRAFFGGDGGEGRPALLDFLTAAVRAQNLAFFVVHKRQNLVEEFLAFLAEELVVGHAVLHNFRKVIGEF